ncbi:MAG: DUF4013 domain-containing protein, partial [Coriobacteriia bacterium]|nr:DUF4013 domain-containing protein [Coriobacteriia bacterium]
MDVNRALTAPFQDKDWVKKASLGGLWALLIVTGPALYGYWLDYITAVAGGRESPLPEWNGFGRYWVRGFLLSIAMAIYLLPALILFGLGFIPLIVAAVSGAPEDAATFAGVGGICLFSLLGFVWAVAVSILVYAAVVNYALRESFGSLFAVGEILQRVRSGGYLQAWLMTLLIWFAAGAVGGMVNAILGELVPFIGNLAGLFGTGFVYFLGAAISGHVLGQWASTAYGMPGTGAPGAAGTAAPSPAPGPYEPPAPPAPPAA